MSNIDHQLHSDKTYYYRGKAKVYLQHFDLDRTTPRVRTISDKHVKSLINTFETEGCLRLNPDNFVKVLINNEVLQRSLAVQELEETDLLEASETHFLDLPSDVRLTVLHGKHRLLAADSFLWDKWWIAQLYSDDMPQYTQNIIREEHPNAEPFTDGDIYRKIRYYQRRGDDETELKWRGRLREGARRELERMERRVKPLSRGLDKLLPFFGLWPSLKLSYLGRVLSLQCHEELVHYMRCIHQKWSDIMAGYSPNLLDPATVASLETLMPEISSCDAAQIQDMMDEKTLFPAVSLESDRRRILDRILKIKGRILSFHTFFADFLYFEACAMVLKRLLPAGFKRTMSNEFLHGYRGSNQLPGLCRIQVAEDCLEHRSGSSDINPNLGYRQLFLAVMRDFPILTDLAPYRDSRKIKPTVNGSELERMFSLSQLAFDLGFETDSIKEFSGQDSKRRDRILARNLLQQLRPPERCVVNEGNTNRLAHYIGDHIDQNVALRASQEQAKFSTNLEPLPRKLRCNRPSHKHYKSDRRYLFLDVIYNYDPIQRAHPTSLAVQRDIFVSFFGEFPLPSRRQQSTPASGSHYSDETTDINTRITQSLPEDEHYGESSQPVQIQQHESYTEHESGGLIYSCLSEYRAESEPMSESSYETASIDTESYIQDREMDSYEPVLSESQHEDQEESKFHQLRGRRPSDVVRDMLKDRDVIVMYVWRRGVYATFSNSPRQRLIFTQFARDFANQGSQFIIIRDGLKPFVASLKNIWDAVCKHRLVLLIPKRSPETPDENFYTEIRRDPYKFIDRYYEPCLDTSAEIVR